MSLLLLALLAFPARATSVPSQPGDLIINEFMVSTSLPDYNSEWFELHNNTADTLELEGLVVTSDGGGFTVEGSLEVPANGYVVLGVNDDPSTNGDTPVDYVYDFHDMNLDPNQDSLSLSYEVTPGTVVILDSVSWNSASWHISMNQAHQLNLNATSLEWANDLPQNWCASDQIYGSQGMRGSPGAANDWCDYSSVDNDGDGFTESQGDCDDDDPYVNPMAIDGDRAPYGNANDDADCDGLRDDGVTDDDGDGYAEVDGDCDDDDIDVYPGAFEGDSDLQADGKDNDCNCYVDDLDYDSDGYSDYTTADREDSPGCQAPDEQDPPVPPDCDNRNADVNPGATELPYNGVDDDCDGFDECDVDGDGYDADPSIYCPDGDCCPDGTDCDDTNDQVHPNASEGDEPDGVDNDCNGIVDDPFQDQDGDGYSVEDGDCWDDPDDPRAALVHPGATEDCTDLLDNDCNGLYNDGCSNTSRFSTIHGGGCGVVPEGRGLGAGLVAFLALVLVGSRQRRR